MVDGGVRVDHEDCVDLFILQDDLKCEFERVALAAALVIVSLENPRPRFPRTSGGRIRAVVRDDDHLEARCGRIAPQQRLNTVRDPMLLVVSRHDDGDAPQRPRRRSP